jgi:RNA polymerase primary sigma factor
MGTAVCFLMLVMSSTQVQLAEIEPLEGPDSLNFCPPEPSNLPMFEADVMELEPTAAETDGTVEDDEPELNAESLFSAEIAHEALLARADEEALAKRIVQARKRVRAILRRARRLARAALADAGRGVVLPEHDFREREAVAVLRFAEQALDTPAGVRATGMDRRALKAYVAELHDALDHYRVVRDQMVRANVRLVAMLARRYRHPTLTFLDLFQEGTLGLLRAVEKYEPERQVKFSTYASWWIWQQLGRTADTQGALIRTPVHWNQLRRRIGRGQDGLEATEALLGDESASGQGVDSTRRDAMTQGFRFVSTDTPSDDDERSLESILASSDEGPEARVLHTSLGKHLESALQQLPPREGFIVRQRFGLGIDDSQTLEEISLHLGVSRERVRQLENRALAKLREMCGVQGLREYLH